VSAKSAKDARDKADEETDTADKKVSLASRASTYLDRKLAAKVPKRPHGILLASATPWRLRLAKLARFGPDLRPRSEKNRRQGEGSRLRQNKKGWAKLKAKFPDQPHVSFGGQRRKTHAKKETDS
jgi:hypothetical protein